MRALFLAFFLFLVLAAPSESGIYGRASAPAPLPTCPGICLGGFANNGAHNESKTLKEGDLESAEATIGRPFAVSLHYYGFTGITSSALMGTPTSPGDAMILGDVKYHRVPLIAWGCGEPLADIAAGKYDNIVDQALLALNAIPVPEVQVRPFHEFNLDFPPNSANGDYRYCFNPADTTDAQRGAEYIAYFEHLVSEAHRLNITKIVWVFCPNVNPHDLASHDLTQFVPPHADRIAGDVYDKAINSSGASIPPVGFQALIAPFYSTFSRYGKPMVIAETGECNNAYNAPGCTNHIGTPWTQAQYFSDICSSATTYPLLVEVALFLAFPSSWNWRGDAAGLAELKVVANATPCSGMFY